MNKVYVITDNWYNLSGELHSTLLVEEGAYTNKDKALLALLNYLDKYEPLDEFKRVLTQDTTLEVYGDVMHVAYHLVSSRLDNERESIYTVNELTLKSNVLINT